MESIIEDDDYGCPKCNGEGFPNGLKCEICKGLGGNPKYLEQFHPDLFEKYHLNV